MSYVLQMGKVLMYDNASNKSGEMLAMVIYACSVAPKSTMMATCTKGFVNECLIMLQGVRRQTRDSFLSSSAAIFFYLIQIK
jgi:hypothetical protein